MRRVTPAAQGQRARRHDDPGQRPESHGQRQDHHFAGDPHGHFITERLLGYPSTPPPPSVPAVTPGPAAARVTIRERNWRATAPIRAAPSATARWILPGSRWRVSTSWAAGAGGTAGNLGRRPAGAAGIGPNGFSVHLSLRAAGRFRPGALPDGRALPRHSRNPSACSWATRPQIALQPRPAARGLCHGGAAVRFSGTGPAMGRFWKRPGPAAAGCAQPHPRPRPERSSSGTSSGRSRKSIEPSDQNQSTNENARPRRVGLRPFRPNRRRSFEPPPISSGARG